MSALQQITAIKRKLESLSADRARQEGALEERKDTLKKLCGTDDLVEAQAELDALQSKNETMEADLDESVTAFEEKYANMLG